MTRPPITPGDWHRDKKAAFRIHGADDRQVAACGGRASNTDADRTEIENEANARFLAASKQMAEALEAEEAWRDASGEESERLRIIANEKRKQALIAAGYSFP